MIRIGISGVGTGRQRVADQEFSVWVHTLAHSLDQLEVPPTQKVTNCDIELAEKVARFINKGREPYAPSIYPLAKAIAFKREQAKS